MKFDTNVDLILGINKKTHDVIMSCTNMNQLSGAKQFVKLAKRFYDNVICKDDMQKSYIAKAIDNIDKVLKIKSIKLKSL
jgi:molybdate-binding protein|tara:strand:+ start:570 stop:809 length:240 start_codon:yes stop_codon:yes gene_type:complete